VIRSEETGGMSNRTETYAKAVTLVRFSIASYGKPSQFETRLNKILSTTHYNLFHVVG